ncbi:MAG: zinc ABC transporter substrate-binding protein [Aquificaceae bacterium]|nr:zinc ABC transporter substrate-binding protein [Aquificaceae bacterium]MDW8096845.1 zinc ABC transporter substrate-binding protein [Aquificaceae bacterium]
MLRAFAILLLSLGFSLAQLKVVATYPWIGEMVREIGRDKVAVHVIAKPTEDFHFVVPRPTHVAKLRGADLLVINGASIEIGFLPPLIQQSNNPKIQPGKPGFLDLSQFVSIIEKPERVSREMGDVHPEGNPHFVYDPHNIPVLARALGDRMCQLRPSDCPFYRSNLEDFLKRWETKLKEWDEGFLRLKGLKVIQWHKTYNYLFLRYGVEVLGTLEPLPGIPPTARHLDTLVKEASGKGVRFVILESFRAGQTRPAQTVAERVGAKVVALPSDVGSEGVKNLFELYDLMLKRLSQ